MNDIFILYDADCAFCVQCKHWIASQNQIVRITFLSAGSAEARRLFPFIDHERTKVDLTAISDVGGVYHDAKAWLMCLWALKEYRSWAFRLASPEMMPSAKSIIATISNNRKALSKMVA
jgi:predicted DCC family thiol-disulfide oxidoreductase YuxK